jgi:hypothetical protein
LEPKDRSDHASTGRQPPGPERLREEIAAAGERIVEDNNALRDGAKRLLIGRRITLVRRFEIHDAERHIILALTLDDGSELEAPTQARITGPLAELCRILGANPSPGEPDAPTPAERVAHPSVLHGCARAVLEGRHVTDILGFEVYDRYGALGFEIALDDENVIEAPAIGRVRGEIAELCRLAGGDPS